MKRLLQSAFGVRPQETAIVLAFFLFFTGIGMFYTVGSAVGDTLFLSHLPSARVPALLPWVYAGVALTNVVAALGFDALSARLPRRLMIVGMQLVLAASVLGYRLLIDFGWSWLYYAGVIWMELAAILSITVFYSFAGDYFTPRDARRLYGFIAGGMALGTVIAGQAIAFAAPRIGTPNLLYGASLILVANAAIALHILRIGTPVVHGPSHEGDTSERVTLGGVFARPYVRYLAVVIPLAIAISVVLDYQMKWIASAKSEAELAQFFGSLFAWVGVAQLLFQFLLVPKLLDRLGIINCLLILPLTLGTASVLLLALPLAPLLSTAAANSLRMTISETLDIPSRELLFLPLPTRIRVRAQTLLVGAVAPMAQGLTAFALLALYALAVDVERLSLIVAIISAVLVLALLRLRPHYRETLASTLREHQLDPTDLERILESPTVAPVLAELLRSDDPGVAKATLELIEERDFAALRPVVRELVDSPHLPVAVSALRILARQHAPDAPEVIEGALESGHRELQAQAALSLCEVLAEKALPRVQELLRTGDGAVRNAAIIGAARYCGQQGRSLALPVLEERVSSDSVTARIEAAELLGDIGQPGHADLLARLLRDAQPQVQRAAVDACAKISDPALTPLLVAALTDATLQAPVLRAFERTPGDAIEPLVSLLTESERSVSQRSLLARVLTRIGGEHARAALSATLDGAEEVALRLAAAEGLVALRQGSEPLELPDVDGRIGAVSDTVELCSRAHHEVRPVDEFSGRMYREHADQHVRLLLCLLALEVDATQIGRVRWNLFEDPEASGHAAIELLDALLPRKLVPAVVGALTYWLETRVARGDGLSRETLQRLRGSDPWLRALTSHYENRSATPATDDAARSTTPAEAQLHQRMDVVELLKGVPLFTDLGADTLAEQAENCEWVELKSGERLFAQGDEGDALYVVCDGEVQVLIDDHEVARLGAGQCLGELAVLDDETRSATVTVASKARLLRISRERWTALLVTQPAVAKALLRTLDQRIRETEASVTMHVTAEPPTRRSQMLRAQNLGLSELISKISFLQQIELFAGLGTPELANVAGIAREVHVLSGDTLFREGDVGESLYMVCEGRLAIEVGGREVNRLERGTCLGEMSLITGRPRSATVRALDDGKLLRVGSDDFESLLESRPEISVGLLRTFAQRLRRTARLAQASGT